MEQMEVIDDVAENEIEAMNMAKIFLSFMPDSINSLPKKIKSKDDPSRSDNFLINIVQKIKEKVMILCL